MIDELGAGTAPRSVKNTARVQTHQIGIDANARLLRIPNRLRSRQPLALVLDHRRALRNGVEREHTKPVDAGPADS
jgi:hypothetical protein